MLILYFNRKRYTTFYKEVSIPYNRARTPANTHIREFIVDPKLGANCELSVLGLSALRGASLPQHLRSEELYLDRSFTRPVSNMSEAETGDIIGVCSGNQQKFRSIHVGILLVEGQTVNLLHNARHIGHAVIEPLSQAQKYLEHEVIAWIRRPTIAQDLSLVNQRILEELELHPLIPKTP